MNFYNIDVDMIRKNNARFLEPYKIQQRYVPPAREQEKPDKDAVNDLQKQFLMAVHNSQYKMTLTETCKSAGLPAGTGSRIANGCVKENLVKIIQPPFGRGRPKYPVLLPDGYKALGVQEKKYFGKGAGHEHILYQHLIAELFSDYKPVIELFRNGKHIDVALETNEFLLAMEVAMSSVHEQENIEKDITLAKANVVIVACINDKILKDVQNIVSQLPENIKNITEACLISLLLKKNPDEIVNRHLKNRRF